MCQRSLLLEARTGATDHCRVLAEGRPGRVLSAYDHAMNIDIRSFAEVGARARLAQLREKTDRILRAFPDLGTNGAASGRRTGIAHPPAAAPARERKPMGAAARAAVSVRMKKYWAARRQANAAAAKGA